MQTIFVILLVTACALWLAYMAYRYLKPKPGGKLCAGGCCEGESKKPATDAAHRTIMVSADDLRNRLQSRK
jgi:hypothetical protein